MLLTELSYADGKTAPVDASLGDASYGDRNSVTNSRRLIVVKKKKVKSCEEISATSLVIDRPTPLQVNLRHKRKRARPLVITLPPKIHRPSVVTLDYRSPRPSVNLLLLASSFLNLCLFCVLNLCLFVFRLRSRAPLPLHLVFLPLLGGKSAEKILAAQTLVFPNLKTARRLTRVIFATTSDVLCPVSLEPIYLLFFQHDHPQQEGQKPDCKLPRGQDCW